MPVLPVFVKRSSPQPDLHTEIHRIPDPFCEIERWGNDDLACAGVHKLPSRVRHGDAAAVDRVLHDDLYLEVPTGNSCRIDELDERSPVSDTGAVIRGDRIGNI